LYGHYGITRESKTPATMLHKLLIKAIEQEVTGKAWEVWKIMLPLMMLPGATFVGFSEYKEKIFKREKTFTEISNEAIEQELTGMIRR